jgi:FlaA1/EpsC-like NDP-sugar epimerase
MVHWAIENAHGTEIFVPKIPSYRIMDVAEAIGPNCEIEYVGIRPGEKLHEEMITTTDSPNTIDIGRYYAILPLRNGVAKKYARSHGAEYVKRGFSYNSGENTQFLSVLDIRNLIIEHISPDFTPFECRHSLRDFRLESTRGNTQ